MQTKKSNSLLEKAALMLSTVFSPLVVPTLACAITFWITPLAHFGNETFRFVACFIVFSITTCVPVAAIAYLIRTGRVSDAAISDRRQRGIPYAIACVCFLLAALYLALVDMPHWLVMFFCGACFATMSAAIINIAWKISAHMITMGGLVALMAYIAINNFYIVAILPWLAGTIVASGMVGSARLLLHRHTPLQVYAGWAFGLVVELMFLYF